MRGLEAFLPSPSPASIGWSLFAGVYTCFVEVAFFTSGFTDFYLFEPEPDVTMLVFYGTVFLSASVSWWILIERDANYTYPWCLVWIFATVGGTFLLNAIYITIYFIGPADSLLPALQFIGIGLLIFGIPSLIIALLLGMVGGPIFMFVRRRSYNG